MTFADPDYPTKFLRQPCVSVGTLYGGAKDQRRNFVRIPPGTTGLVICLLSNEYGIDHYLVKFTVGKRHLFSRCPLSRLNFLPAKT